MLQRISHASLSRSPARGAFTLMELLVVVAIIIVLIGIFIPIVGSAKKHAMNSATVAQLGALRTAIAQYYTDFNVYPSSQTPAHTSTNNASFPATGLITSGRGCCTLAQALVGFLPYNVDGCGPTLYGSTGASANPSDPVYGFRE